MVNEAQTKVTPPSGFVQRVVFWVAAVCLGYALVAITVLDPYVSFVTRGSLLRGVEEGLRLLVTALTVMLLFGAAALLRHRRWGAVLLVVWAVTQILQRLVSNAVFYVLENIARMPATRPSGASVGLMAFSMLVNWIEGSAFPLLVCAILLQKEVRQLWARPGKGFEVVPLATPASTDASDVHAVESGAPDLTKENRGS